MRGGIVSRLLCAAAGFMLGAVAAAAALQAEHEEPDPPLDDTPAEPAPSPDQPAGGFVAPTP